MSKNPGCRQLLVAVGGMHVVANSAASAALKRGASVYLRSLRHIHGGGGDDDAEEEEEDADAICQ